MFPVTFTRGAAPLPKAPIRPGPLRRTVALSLAANVSPRRKRMRLRLAILLLIAASKSELASTAAPAGQPADPATGSVLPTQSVLAANTVSGSLTVICTLFVTVATPSSTVRLTLYVPGASNTCAATGPVAWLRLGFGMAGVLVHEPLAGSPKSHRYSSSWKGRLVVAAVLAVASKNT